MLKELLRRIFTSRSAVETLLADARACEAAEDEAGAQRLYRELLFLQPSHAEAHRRLGTLLGRAGRLADARPLLERALALEPANPAALSALANVNWLQGQSGEAERLYRQAIAADPGNADACANLGWLLWRQSRRAEALDAFLQAYRLDPARSGLLDSVSRLLVETDRPDAALAHCERAALAGRDDPELQVASARALHALCRYEEALACYERAGIFSGNDADRLTEAARTLQELGQAGRAAEVYERAIALKPGHPVARWHRALLRLSAGDYAAGWDDYAMRLQSEDRPARVAHAPAWDGEPFDGRDVLVYGEQGLGDELMFASCVPDLLARAGRVRLEVSPRLERLMTQSFPQATVFAAGGGAVPPPVAARRPDFEVPAGSLPGVFRRSLDAFPAKAGYLRADPAAVAAWRTRLDALGPGLKVGLSWRGGTLRTRQPLRSLALADLAPLLRARAVRGVSLQYGDAAAEVRAFAETDALPVTHWPDAIDDLAQMAALISALDLVISVCNTTIHLGGALGRPVWVLAPQVPEWRYGIAGDGMPWYPSVRIFRQARAGAWPPVIERVAAALAALP